MMLPSIELISKNAKEYTMKILSASLCLTTVILSGCGNNQTAPNKAVTVVPVKATNASPVLAQNPPALLTKDRTGVYRTEATQEAITLNADKTFTFNPRMYSLETVVSQEEIRRGSTVGEYNIVGDAITFYPANDPKHFWNAHFWHDMISFDPNTTNSNGGPGGNWIKD